jgi:hypothetical protein
MGARQKRGVDTFGLGGRQPTGSTARRLGEQAPVKRHPEVRAFWRASKDVWQGAGPVSFEARIRSRLRMTGICRWRERHPEEAPTGPRKARPDDRLRAVSKDVSRGGINPRLRSFLIPPHFAQSISQLICPSCQCVAGHFACDVGQIRCTDSAVPRSSKRGASRSSRTLGAGCDGRMDTRRRCASMRTAKSCGPDASTPASSCVNRFRAATVTRKPDHRGEHEVSC